MSNKKEFEVSIIGSFRYDINIEAEHKDEVIEIVMKLMDGENPISDYTFLDVDIKEI